MGNNEAKIPPWAEGVEQPEEPKEKKQKEIVEDPKSKNIISKVFEKLGKPKNLCKYTVKNVYGNRYRVNLIKDDGSIGLDSFFLHISSNGEIVYADPEIVRRY
jgi:hypothetical protein